MQSQIRHVKFKPGLPLEIEVIPIADTVIKHQDTIKIPHRAEFYHIFWVQNGTAEYLIDFEPVKVKANSSLFVNKDRGRHLIPGAGTTASSYYLPTTFLEKQKMMPGTCTALFFSTTS